MPTYFLDLPDEITNLHLRIRFRIRELEAGLRDIQAILNDMAFQDTWPMHRASKVDIERQLGGEYKDLHTLNALIRDTYPDFEPPAIDRHWFTKLTT